MSNLAVIVIIAIISHKVMASQRDGINPLDLPKMRTGHLVSITSSHDQAIEQYHQTVKAKITPAFRGTVPVELFLLSGFTAEEQDSLDMSGCYIRLGINLMSYDALKNHKSLAATAFMNSGSTYVTISNAPCLTESNAMEDIEARVDYLMSGVQCYYWAFYNEDNPQRKQTLKKVIQRYHNRLSNEIESVNDNALKKDWNHKANLIMQALSNNTKAISQTILEEIIK